MGARILVADDSVTIQKVVELTFSKEDFTLTQARSGEEAIRKAKEVRPDLVLLDLVMPDMNGYDVCAALRAEPALRAVPVILLAGSFESFDQQRGAQVGANDFVTKPFESQVLIGKVKQLLFAKAMEADRTAAYARPSADAVTVRIPSAHATAGMALSPPRSSAATQPLTPMPAATPPPEELWHPPAPPTSPVATPLEPTARFDAETIALERLPAEPEGLTLDLSAIELEPLPTAAESLSDALDVLPLPESLSLDDLLGVGPDVTPPAPPASASDAETPASESVFELAEPDAPALPLVEVGKGEPSTLSVEDLLGTAVGSAAPADTLTLELRELDLTSLSEIASPSATEDTSAGFGILETVAEPAEVVRPEPSEAPVLAPVIDTISAVVPPDVALVTDAAEVVLSVPEPLSSDTPTEMRPPRVEELGVVSLEAPIAGAPHATGKPASEVVASHEMAAMREAVTARVADELRHELSEKLLERFEKIVWEVVPDLAEILITKEIERIRRLAEEEQQS